MPNHEPIGNTALRHTTTRPDEFSPTLHVAGLIKILYFAQQQLWPINNGARLRNYQLARQLAAHSSVTFVEMLHAGEERQTPPNDSGLASVVTLDKGRAYTAFKLLRGMTGPTPVTVLNCWSRRLASQLADVLRGRQFDTVQIEGVHLMEYLPIIQQGPGRPAIVVDWHNIESELMWRYAKTNGNWLKRAAAARTAALIELAEDRLLATRAMHTVASERERQKLLARHPSANIQVIPNGVDTSYWSAKEIAEAGRQISQRDPKPTVLFVGSMDYHSNIDAVRWFSRVAWPEIARNHPDLEFTIVGRDPAPAVRALASERIHVTGTVDDVRPFYASAVVAVVPLRSGSGTRLKILEAMAAGVPVVSTPMGAEGLEVEHDVHLLLADTGPEFAAAVRHLTSSAETRSRLSQSARALVCRTYDWSAIGEQLYGIHADLMESRSPRSLRKVS
jgi:sugar transferase (PEP-CTERM/EpsH1 system associated)